jgi:hypothetical protein
MTGFYEFRQNNSGASIVVDSNLGIGEYIYIWATSWSEANEKASNIGLFGLPYCECCGERFYSLWQYDEPMKDGQEDNLFSMEDEIVIFFHLPLGEIRSAIIPNLIRGKTIKYTWSEEVVRQLTSN